VSERQQRREREKREKRERGGRKKWKRVDDERAEFSLLSFAARSAGPTRLHASVERRHLEYCFFFARAKFAASAVTVSSRALTLELDPGVRQTREFQGAGSRAS